MLFSNQSIGNALAAQGDAARAVAKFQAALTIAEGMATLLP
jgi:hypothetical protein